MLPENQKEKWVTVAPSNPSWESFYSILEGVITGVKVLQNRYV